MIAKEIIEFMENWAPKEIAEDWDNVGFQIGDDSNKVEKILLSLDLDNRVLKKAKNNGIQMIITHHPFIFSGMKNINSNSYDGNLTMNVIKNNIIVFNAHTNLDKTVEGVNHELGRLFNLKNSKVLEKTFESTEVEYGYGVVGNIDEISVDNFINIVKEVLNIDHLTIYGEYNNINIKKIAIVGGSGSDFIESAAKEDVDIFITGDIKYHDAQLAEKLGIVLIDAGHYHTEKVILPVIKKKLMEFNEKLEIHIYDKPSPIYKII